MKMKGGRERRERNRKTEMINKNERGRKRTQRESETKENGRRRRYS